MVIASSPTSPSRSSRSDTRTESPTHPESNYRVRFLTFPWGKVSPQRRKRGGTRSVPRTAPHPSGPGAEGTPETKNVPHVCSPRRKVAFPHGEGGPGAARAGCGAPTLSWERVGAKGPDGCGAGQGLSWYCPSFTEFPALSKQERVAPQGRVWRGPLKHQVGPG